MKYTFLLLISLAYGLLSCNSSSTKEEAKGKQPVFQMEEFHQRDGLPNLFYKINNQRQIRIGYIGGSITEAREGWRDLTFNWFKLTFPYTAFYQINAAIGGTGSDLGVFRVERDMLVQKPDLLFIEFAVNDAGRTREQILDSMEGLIRKTWSEYPETDLCLVYTTAEPYCDSLVNGKQHHASLAMEELADHYGIPSIHMGVEVARLYAEGKVVLKADPSENANKIVFTKDRTHPLSESGHPLYAAVVARYLDKMKQTATAGKHTLPAPYVTSNWQNARFIDLSEITLKGDWQKLSDGNQVYEQFRQSLPSLYKAGRGAVMEFSFKGTQLGFYDCVGPGTGMIEITVDGKTIEKNRFDQWCDNYRKHNFMLDTFDDGIHQVSVKVTGQPMDKAEILSKKNIRIDNPAKYAGLDWYPANIMIVGEIVK